MPKLLDQVRNLIRVRHYSIRTEEAYTYWIREFILFHKKRHPANLGAPDVASFLTYLATVRKVAASTQNQAASAILFLYRDVLGLDIGWLDDVERAKKPSRLPVVFTREEARIGSSIYLLLAVVTLVVGKTKHFVERIFECGRVLCSFAYSSFFVAR